MNRFFLTMLCTFFYFSQLISGEEAERFFDENAPQNNACQVTSVVNKVSVISGDWTDFEEDAVVIAPLPITLQRSYSSSDTSQDFLYRGWHMNHPEDLITDDKKTYAYCGEPFGVKQKFIDPRTYDRKKKHYMLFPYISDGMTNMAPEISGRTNPKNSRLIVLEKEKQVHVKSGAGDIRFFDYAFTDHYNLVKDLKPNGCSFGYSYCKGQRPETIGSYSPYDLLLGWMKFSYSEKEDEPVILIQTSDGQSLTYNFESYKCKDHNGDKHVYKYLKEAHSTRKPSISYDYTEKDALPFMQVSRKKYPDGRFEAINYYQKEEKCLVNGQKIKVGDRKDFRVDRVKELLAPVGVDATPIVTHRFIYEEDKKTSNIPGKEKKDIRGGKTKVYNALNHLKVFTYGKNQRMDRIDTYKGTNHPFYILNSEGYAWGEKGSPDEGNLLCKYVLNSRGEAQSAETFQYDKKGNVLANTLYGNLSGVSNIPLIFDQNNRMPIENGCEKYVRRFEYTSSNLIAKEYEPYGREIHYAYDQKDQLYAKYVICNGEIKIRNFFFYDENGQAAKHIRDDGSSPVLENFSGVTERHITKTKYNAQGLPILVEEYGTAIAAGDQFLLNKIVYTYSPEGYKIREDVYDSYDSYRFSNHWEYDLYGNVIKEINGIGDYSEFSYDLNGNLIFEQGPNKNWHAIHTYDYSNRRIRTEEVHADGYIFVETFQYDYLGNLIKKCDRYGSITEFAYNEFNKPILEKGHSVIVPNLGIANPVLLNEYDDLGRLVKTQDACGSYTLIAYNSRGQEVLKQYHDGTYESWNYRLDGLLASYRSQNGMLTTIQYDYLDRPILKTLYAADGSYIGQESFIYNSFHLLYSTNLAGVTTQYIYDQAGRLITTIIEDKVAANEYDSLGRCIRKIEWFGHNQGEYRVQAFEFDILNRVIEERIEGSNGKLYSKKQMAYDCDGNISTTVQFSSESQASAVYTEFNSQKLPKLIIDELGRQTVILYNHCYINAFGQTVLQTTTIDPSGIKTINTFDPLHRLASIEKINPFGVTFYKKEHYYDLIGNQVETIDYVYKLSDQKELIRGVKTIWEYSPTKKLLSITEASGTPEQKITQFQYNHLGQKCKMVKPDGTIIEYAYDQKDRLQHYKDNLGAIHYSYQYDANDKPILITDHIQNVITERKYDRLGNIVHEKQAHGLEVGYDYDRLGRVIEVILPDHSKITMQYNAKNAIAVRRFDDQGRLLYVHENLECNFHSKPIVVRLPKDAGTIEYIYDPKGQVLEIRHPQFHQKITKRDPSGNILGIESSDPEGGLSHSYSYDEMNQLTTEKNQFEHTYCHDSLNNRLAQDSRQNILNSLNQLLHDSEITYNYDANGNQVQTDNKGKTIHYTYDSLDRLVKISKGEEEYVYQYDAFNRRLSKTITTPKGTEVERYIYLGENEVGRVDEQNQIVELRVLHTGGSSESCYAVAFELAGDVYVPIYDQAGNVACLVDGQGQAVASYRYSAFGEEKVYGDSSLNPWRFASKRKDVETGYVYFGRRYYNPETGRWITPDPIGSEGGPNLYAYVLNNPLILIDFFGCYPVYSVLNSKMDNFRLAAHSESNTIRGAYRDLKYEKNQRYWWNKELLRHGELPIIKYKRQGTQTVTECFKGEKELTNGSIYFAPGVGSYKESTIENTEGLSRYAGGYDVTYIHNQSQGLYYDLFRRAGVNLRSYVCNEAAVAIQNAWMDHFNKFGKDVPLLQVCHSEGAINVRNALLGFPKELRDKIMVIAVAPAAHIDERLCKNVVHLVSNRDVVPILDGARGSNVTRLNSHPNRMDIIDHSFLSPTYEEKIRRGIMKYVELINQ